jgi:hypothetical protein
MNTKGQYPQGQSPKLRERAAWWQQCLHTLNMLNSYDGNNVWGDVICRLPEYDAKRSDPNRDSDRFVAAGTEYRYHADQGRWEVR